MRYTIGEMAEIIDGDRGKNYPQQHEFLDEGYCLFLNTGNVTKAGFSFDSNQFISKEKCDLLRKGKLQRHDIVYTTRGTVGNAAFYSDSIPYEHVRINSGMVIIRPKETIVCTEFLYQILKSDYYRPFFRKYCTGSAQPQLPIKNFSTIELDLPDLPVQRFIAGILSSYDDLIENNQRQIKLLEEAAQRLYKEWFVDLRFPGHEITLIVDCVPEGWKKDSLGSICTLKKDTVSAGKIPVGTPYIGLEHMPRVDFCLSSWGNAEEVTSNKFQYTEDDIIFGKIRPYFHKVGFALNSGVVSTDSFVLKANDGLWGLLLMTVFDKLFVDYTYQTCKEGAKMPRADWGQMEKYPVLIPPESVRQDFEEFIWNNTRRVKVLALQNHALAEARDRLLPKLMSGESEVENI